MFDVSQNELDIVAYLVRWHNCGKCETEGEKLRVEEAIRMLGWKTSVDPEEDVIIRASKDVNDGTAKITLDFNLE